MGCDIHALVEYERDNAYWSLARGEFSITRDYRLFTILALGEGGIKNNLPYPPRGLPVNLSLEAQEVFFSDVEEVRNFMSEVEGDEDFRPEDYIAALGEWASKVYAENRMLPTPELHTASWLNFGELKETLDYGKLSVDELTSDFRAVFAAMRVLAGEYGADKVRLVFCFDG